MRRLGARRMIRPAIRQDHPDHYLCDLNRIRLTVAAVLVPRQVRHVIFLNDRNCCRILATGWQLGDVLC